MSALGPTVTLIELAAMLHRTPANASRYLRKLEGFPPPLPGSKPKLWSRHQVEAWFRDPARAAASPLPANDARDPAFSPENVAAGRARLAQRYGAR